MPATDQGFSIEDAEGGVWIGHREQRRKEGSWCYFENRLLRKTVRYVDGLKQGLGLVFGPKGNLLRSLEFDQDRIHGEATFFAADGQLIARYRYIYDKLERVEFLLLHAESPPKHKTYLPEF
jgi:hypothetical protein